MTHPSRATEVLQGRTFKGCLGIRVAGTSCQSVQLLHVANPPPPLGVPELPVPVPIPESGVTRPHRNEVLSGSESCLTRAEQQVKVRIWTRSPTPSVKPALLRRGGYGPRAPRVRTVGTNYCYCYSMRSFHPFFCMDLPGHAPGLRRLQLLH